MTPTSTATATTGSPTTDGATPLDPGGPPGPGTEAAAADVVLEPTLADEILETTVKMAKSLGYPLWWLLMIVAFLAIQNRIDSGDPKLALASVRRAAQLRFTHPHRPEES